MYREIEKNSWGRRPSTETLCLARDAEIKTEQRRTLFALAALQRAHDEGRIDSEYAGACLGWTLQEYSHAIFERFEEARRHNAVYRIEENPQQKNELRFRIEVALGHTVASPYMLRDKSFQPEVEEGLLHQMTRGTYRQRIKAINMDANDFVYGKILPGFRSDETASYAADAVAFGLWVRIRQAILSGADQETIDELYARVKNPVFRTVMQGAIASMNEDDIYNSLQLNEENPWNGDTRSRQERRSAKFKKTMKRLAAVVAAAVILPNTVSAFTSDKDSPAHTNTRLPEQHEKKIADKPRVLDRKINVSNEGICLNPDAAKLLETDCNILPKLRDVAEFEFTKKYGNDTYDESTIIGEITNGETHLDVLPSEYRSAFEAALSDPFVGEIAKDTPIIIRQSDFADDENGAYMQLLDEINLIFSVEKNTNTAPDTLYPTWGSIRTVLIHEMAHKVYWLSIEKRLAGVEDRDMAQLDHICAQDLRAAEKDLGASIQLKLDKLERVINRLDVTTQIKQKMLHNVSMLRRAEYDTEFIRDKTILRPDKTNHFKSCELIDISSYINDGLSHTDIDTVYKADRKGDKYRLYFAKDGLDEVVNQSVRKVFQSREDGAVSAGLNNKGAGHAWQNVNERFASTVANVQTNPDGYISTVLDLPNERAKNNELKFIQSTFNILRKQKPELAEQTNFDYVINKLQEITK